MQHSLQIQGRFVTVCFCDCSEHFIRNINSPESVLVETQIRSIKENTATATSCSCWELPPRRSGPKPRFGPTGHSHSWLTRRAHSVSLSACHSYHFGTARSTFSPDFIKQGALLSPEYYSIPDFIFMLWIINNNIDVYFSTFFISLMPPYLNMLVVVASGYTLTVEQDMCQFSSWYVAL